MDKQGLRVLAVGLPGTLSMGAILTDLGVTGAASLGDVLTVTATTVVYVPAVNGNTGGPGPGSLRIDPLGYF